MTTMKELMKFADRIKDRDLKAKVLDVLGHPGLTNKSLEYPGADFEKAPASINFHHIHTGGLVEHTYSVTNLSISVAEALHKVYKVPIDMDALIAAALVHDIGKLWGMKKTEKGWEPTGLTLDHTMLGTSELYSRGFPEKVLHIVASHFGPEGPTPPQTLEAMVFHTIDNMDATIGTPNQEDILKLLLG